MADSLDWQRRLLLSLLLSVVVVLVSCVIVLSLDAQQPRSGHVPLFEYILGLPLAPGWLVVSLFFGDWRAVHQGQIALVPFISVAVDAFVIFLVWELIRKMSTDTAMPS